MRHIPVRRIAVVAVSDPAGGCTGFEVDCASRAVAASGGGRWNGPATAGAVVIDGWRPRPHRHRAQGRSGRAAVAGGCAGMRSVAACAGSVAPAPLGVRAFGATRRACTATWRSTAAASRTSSPKACRAGCAWRTSAPTVRRRHGRTSRVWAIWTGCWPGVRSASCRPGTCRAPVVRWIRNGWWPSSRPRPSRPWPTGSAG